MTTQQTRRQLKTTKQLEEALAVIQHQATENAKEQVRIANLAEQALVLARGTRDVTEKATEVVAASETKPDNLRERIHEALVRRGPTTVLDLQELLEIPGAHVQQVMKALRADGLVENVGNTGAPVWTWVVGDAGTTPDLNAHVEKLIRFKPLKSSDIEKITKAGRNRIQGVLVKIQWRLEDALGKNPVQKIMKDGKVHWYIPPGTPSGRRVKRTTSR
jgi:hypothetical protein